MMKYEISRPLLSAAMSIYIILILLFLTFLFLAVTLLSSSKYKFLIDKNEISIKSVVYNTYLSLSDIDFDNVRVVNMNEEVIVINKRTNGIGLPGMQIGWFLGNGKRYKLYITDRTQVVYIPTKKDYTILFSSPKANEIVQELVNKNCHK